jgi:hypothetical protein
LFYLARQFFEEAKNNITDTNLVKSASRDFQYIREEEEEETANSILGEKKRKNRRTVQLQVRVS